VTIAMKGAAVRRRGRTSGAMYTGLSLAIILVVAALAVTASQSAPPPIAELSPSAEQIKDAPPEQASELGNADGGAGIFGGTSTSTTTTLPPGAVAPVPVRQPRQRRCVGTPLRQTEDPQSPPCVASWSGGDNGGATSKGVTGDEIRVAVPTVDGKLNRHIDAMQLYFNSRYEMYGRKLRLIPFQGAGDNVPCARMKPDAIKVDKEIDAFASLVYLIQRGNEACYYDELARRGVMSMQSGHNPPAGGEAHLEKFAPFQWNYLPSLDKILLSLGEVICKNLQGRAPAHALGAQRAALVRTFGLVTEVPLAGAPTADTALLDSALRACGVEPVRVPQNSNVEPAERATLAKAAVLKLKDAGVTSVICLCDASYLVQYIFQQSTLETYYPEWIVQDYMAQDHESQIAVSTQNDQKTQIFGIRSWNKAIGRDMPFWPAMREADPTFPPEQYLFSMVYWNLLILASGIQAAGPHLTPQAFQAGLYATKFSNPGCGGPPYYQGCVGFGPNNHTMVQDATLVWYDTQAKPRDTDPTVAGPTSGGYCYVDNGRRYKPGQFPAGDPAFFQPTCA
jgi:hypothetical protein